MSATGFFCEDNGAATLSVPVGSNRGASRTSGVGNVNWKTVDDVATAYGSAPVTGGNNSMEKYQFVTFTGTYNQIANCLWQHVSGNMDAGVSLYGGVSGSGFYQTPSTGANFLINMSSTGLLSTGYAVKVGGFGPEASGKATSTVVNPAFSEYLGTQIRTTTAAAPGDLSQPIIFQFRFDQN